MVIKKKTQIYAAKKKSSSLTGVSIVPQTPFAYANKSEPFR